MATVRDSPGAVGSETSGARAALRARGSLGFAVVVALVLLPLAVVLVAIARGKLASGLGPRRRGLADRRGRWPAHPAGRRALALRLGSPRPAAVLGPRAVPLGPRHEGRARRGGGAQRAGHRGRPSYRPPARRPAPRRARGRRVAHAHLGPRPERPRRPLEPPGSRSCRSSPSCSWPGTSRTESCGRSRGSSGWARSSCRPTSATRCWCSVSGWRPRFDAGRFGTETPSTVQSRPLRCAAAGARGRGSRGALDPAGPPAALRGRGQPHRDPSLRPSPVRNRCRLADRMGDPRDRARVSRCMAHGPRAGRLRCQDELDRAGPDPAGRDGDARRRGVASWRRERRRPWPPSPSSPPGWGSSLAPGSLGSSVATWSAGGG